MKKTILLALALVAFVAMPAMASVQNVKISGSVDSTWLLRNDFNLGKHRTVSGSGGGVSATGDEVQNLFITQAILRADADLTDNVSTTIALINERAWGEEADELSTDIDLLLAYVTLREMLYSPLTVVAGRQAFHYGNSFIVDSAGVNSSTPADSGLSGVVGGDITKQTVQDAFRFIFDYEPLSIEVLVSKIDSNTNTAASGEDDDVDLYGVNAGYEVGDSMNTQIEAYFFAKLDKDKDGNSSNTSSKPDTVYVPGLRASTNPIEGLNVQAEVAWQKGNRVATTGTISDNEQRDAIGAQLIASYQVPVLEEYKPILAYVYTYVSGDSNPDDRSDVSSTSSSQQASTNKYTAWDPMFENQAGGTVYNSLFSLTNAHIHTVSAQVNPIEDVTTKVSWTNLTLDRKLHSDAFFALLQPDGTAQTIGFNAGEDEVGNEVDVIATYDYTEDVQIGANLGWFMPGDLFTEANDNIASQAIIHANVNF